MSFLIGWLRWLFHVSEISVVFLQKLLMVRNYTLGLKSNSFSLSKYDEVASIHGMDITVVTTARTNDEGRRF